MSKEQRRPEGEPKRATAEREHVGWAAPGPLRAHQLSSGETSSLVTAIGTGVTSWRGIDVNRFREDALLDGGGIYLYVQNCATGHCWSTSYHPTRATPAAYDVCFEVDRVTFERRDGDVQTRTEIALALQAAAEVRSVTLSNRGSTPVELELTSYTDVVLAPRAADVAHRAFGGLFVETEALPEQHALLAQRHPRQPSEPNPWLVQTLSGDENWGALDYDTSRASFLGRRRDARAPASLVPGRGLSKQVGRVLDPALVLRRRIRIAAGASASLRLWTALAPTRDRAIEWLETLARAPDSQQLASGLKPELRALGVTNASAQRYQRLLSALLFPHPALRSAPPSPVSGGRDALLAHGISPEATLLLLRLDAGVDRDSGRELCRDVSTAQQFLRANGVACELVILNETDSSAGWAAELGESIDRGARNGRSAPHVLNGAALGSGLRELLAWAARVVLRTSAGSLEAQLQRPGRSLSAASPIVPAATLLSDGSAVGATSARPALELDNGFGGFADRGRQYVIVLEPGTSTPAPWCNVMANPRFGSLVSEAGSSFTWLDNSQRQRLTPWSNDPVSDPSGEAIYIRDEETGQVWSPTPEPAGAPARYLVRHAAGETRFEHEAHGLAQELSVFVSPRDPVKVSLLRIHNQSSRRRQLSLFAVVEWVLGGSREYSRIGVCSRWDATAQASLAHHPLSSFPDAHAFFTSSSPIHSWSQDREEFFGVEGSRTLPRALGRSELSRNEQPGLDPCAALQLRLTLEPGARAELGFALGRADSLDEALRLVAHYRRPGVAAAALEEARRSWDEVLDTVRVQTPDPALDALANRWLLYQTLSGRLWARTGFYQSSGAFGFRDQLQDSLALLHARPELVREHLLRCARRQFEKGDVQHWWHDETGEGVRTRCSDDMLWLPYAVAQYVRATGDRALLEEQISFLSARPLAAGEDDSFGSPAVSAAHASLYEHCTRALDVGTTRGHNGLPTLRGGDWNDGMNRVGHEGRGESIWLAWFLARTLLDFADLARGRGDADRVQRCEREVARLSEAVERHGWDGEWYLRAFFDDGSPLGSARRSECQIDAIAQSWAVIAGIGDPQRAARAMDASETRLVDPEHRLIRLLDPPFEHSTPDPGYIQAYPAGIRENGGQYTHGVLWTVLARTLQGDGDRAGALLELLNPVYQGARPERLAQYRVEPYVLAGDVYSAAEHAGRGGWTWYTGSAGWMYRIIVEHVIGLQRHANTLRISPCIPSSWPSFAALYRHASATYQIRVDNPRGVTGGVSSLMLDGQVLPGAELPLADDRATHEVVVVLGPPAPIG